MEPKTEHPGLAQIIKTIVRYMLAKLNEHLNHYDLILQNYLRMYCFPR